jgi:glycosyltransferase involved in cell wall biosynthesis
MRFGIMLRTLDESGGIAVYSRYLTEELLRIDRANEYVLFYRSSSHLGRFSGQENVTERLVRAPNKALWDQAAIPRACWREKVNVVVHPKFTVPLLAPCKAVMVLHGADWFVPEQARFYSRLDVAYVRAMMPLYIRRASAVLSVSRLTTENINRALGLAPGKVQTVYFGPARHFRRIEDGEALRAVRAKYGLPDRFIFTLAKLGGAERKNLHGVLEAYRRYYGSTDHKLVIGGKDGDGLRAQSGLGAEGYGRDVLFPGWIAQEDLPAVYTLADLFLYPSNLEAFPIPITEAMACGTPIVTSDANGLTEIAGDAAVRVDPGDPDAICEGVRRVLADPALRTELAARGLRRSKMFSWQSCARRTLEILERLDG